MRKLLLLAVIASLTGCSTFSNMFGGSKRKEEVGEIGSFEAGQRALGPATSGDSGGLIESRTIAL